GFDNGELRLWDVGLGKPEQTKNIKRDVYSSISGLAALNENQALSVSFNGDMQLWNLETGEAALIFHVETVRTIAALNEKQAISAAYNGAMCLWNLDTREIDRIIRVEKITSITVANSHHVIAGSYDRTIKVWDVQTGEEVRSFAEPTGEIQNLLMLD